jgi:signal transduction histidine kinase
VFKEYGRAKGTREKGTGLGLSLSKRLVEINDGKIWFNSEYEKGTTFYVRFKKED